MTDNLNQAVVILGNMTSTNALGQLTKFFQTIASMDEREIVSFWQSIQFMKASVPGDESIKKQVRITEKAIIERMAQVATEKMNRQLLLRFENIVTDGGTLHYMDGTLSPITKAKASRSLV